MRHIINQGIVGERWRNGGIRKPPIVVMGVMKEFIEELDVIVTRLR